MVKIITTGKDNLVDLWEKSNILDPYKRSHHPFIVFIEKDDVIKVELFNEIRILIESNLPDTTRIMFQWGGEWRSDFFHFSLKELREAFYKIYPKDDRTKIEQYYKLYFKETGKQAIRGNSETKIFQQWYYSKKRSESLNKK